ncbi:NAC domain-containing protein 83-like [Ananas comosus]|uniref:NAC domain-containing protein 83 n=1 Tax=Ananas comosus TaxID=4615 RepID=A0A199UQA0_ANACO|nr:NAC domain-containing protein 83-like [Ananas comosus]OAY67002.1 NAC domain-containing protein 83 [Ananas comosus]
MEKQSVVRHGGGGVVRLPPGFRFHPTDEELVLQYLKRKVLSWPLPAAIIPEVDLSKFDPWVLPGGGEDERYFFNRVEAKYPNGIRSNRATVSGYWKATGKDRQIVGGRFNQVVGMKKFLVFYQGRPPRGTKTDWIMHEYRLSGPESHNPAVSTNGWVLCRIFKKKRATTTEVEIEEQQTPVNPAVFIGLMRRREHPSNPPSPSSSSSDSSCVTDLSDESANGEETSSSCNRSAP